MKTPVSRRALRGALALPLLFGLPLLAQDVLVPTYRVDGTEKQVTITTTYPREVPQLLLVAPDGELAKVAGTAVLKNGAVIGIEPLTRAAEWILPFPPEIVAKYDIYVQALVLDGDQLVGGPVVPTRDLLQPDPFQAAPQKGPLAEVDTWLERDDAGKYRFAAQFTATSDGYALLDVATLRHGNATQVYLTLKTPGYGEGYLDVMQELEVVVPLGAGLGPEVHVFAFTASAPFTTALDRYVGFERLPTGDAMQ